MHLKIGSVFECQLFSKCYTLPAISRTNAKLLTNIMLSLSQFCSLLGTQYPRLCTETDLLLTESRYIYGKWAPSNRGMIYTAYQENSEGNEQRCTWKTRLLPVSHSNTVSHAKSVFNWMNLVCYSVCSILPWLTDRSNRNHSGISVTREHASYKCIVGLTISGYAYNSMYVSINPTDPPFYARLKFFDAY